MYTLRLPLRILTKSHTLSIIIPNTLARNTALIPPMHPSRCESILRRIHIRVQLHDLAEHLEYPKRQTESDEVEEPGYAESKSCTHPEDSDDVGIWCCVVEDGGPGCPLFF